jgi:hypothetical protein
MALYIDKKYVNLVSSKLDRFVQKKQDLWNFRCPFCGDSKKNKIKSRGFLYVKRNSVFYRCHNCYKSISLGTFLKEMDSQLFSEYRMDYYKEGKHSNVPSPEFVAPVKVEATVGDLKIPSVDTLPQDHIAVKYVKERRIPIEQWNRLYYTNDFKAFVRETFPNGKTEEELKKWKDGDIRLVIPFFDQNKKLQGAQGRTLVNSKVRYITVKAFESAIKLYGLEKVDFTKKIYVVEGPLDSLFLDNSVATMDASLESIYELLGNYEYVFVPDAEPRNKEVVRIIKKMIDHGRFVCLFPEEYGKDINEIVLKNNFNQQNLMNLVTKYTYQGLHAQLEFTKWKKC